MAEPLSNSARRVQEAIAARGMTLSVRELPATTRTATEAAAALGCGVPPVGHREPMRYSSMRICSGTTRSGRPAGTPPAVFRLRPSDLRILTGGRIVGVT